MISKIIRVILTFITHLFVCDKKCRNEDEELEKLIAYVRTYQYKLPWKEMEDKECSICMEDITPTNGGYMDCGHPFHNHCIKQWFDEIKVTCPMCRTKTYPVKFKSI